jgi:L-lysine exporter family protein LysE/ArgO
MAPSIGVMSASPLFAAWATGFALGASLIVAIGAQNAFVLRQGLAREHVGAVALFCAAADALLMTAGVLGLGRAIAAVPMLASVMAGLGAAFLVAYGARALWRAWRPGALHAGAGAALRSRARVLAQAAAFTFLNPHVYLDTVLLVGTLGAQQPAPLRPVFLAGACAASAVWFFGLAYGARWLAPLFARPGAWRALDGVIGLTMFTLAALLLRGLGSLPSLPSAT